MSQALPEDALLLAEVFEKVPSAIIVLDEQGCVKRANQSASKLLGLEVQEHERWVELVSKVFRPRQDDGHEISTKDGRRLQVITLDLQQGQLIQMTDLTETRALQDKIAHMERLSSLGRMAASLAHQIRTPLSAAMLYAANLGNANLQPMARKRFQEKLMGRLEALEAQVSDILMFARSNEQTVTEIDASHLVDQTANNVSAVLSKGNAELETISDTGEMPILGNATALTGALSNLVANAVEAGANKIILKLTKNDDANTITFSVANNGPEIPEELKQKIFEPFFTSKSSGTGLGLAVVTAVTKVHQGTLQLESWNEEYATVFSITIPLYIHQHIESVSLRNTVSSLKTEAADEPVGQYPQDEQGTKSPEDYATQGGASQTNEYVEQGYEGASASNFIGQVTSSYEGFTNVRPSYAQEGDQGNDYQVSDYGSSYTSEDAEQEVQEDNAQEYSFEGTSYTAIGMGQIHAGTLDQSFETGIENLNQIESLSQAHGLSSSSSSKRGQIGSANAVLAAAMQRPSGHRQD